MKNELKRKLLNMNLCFIGSHHGVNENERENLEKSIQEIILKNNVDYILTTNYKKFEQQCLAICRNLQKTVCPNLKFVYYKMNYNHNPYYKVVYDNYIDKKSIRRKRVVYI